ncbi:hypothetical protein [Nocardia wallacei]|uniref:hypothetical protein n=1 Tax=Nocardia wallacei TaxID=480035 RepID=UPI002458C9E5|nr:hypothetical protein [Nocardia wallacei]
MLRDVLEDFGIQVNYMSIGQARHLLAAFGGDRAVAPYVIVCCHGGDDVILMPELGGEVAAKQPFNSRLGPDEVRKYLRFPGSTVLCTGCDTGNPGLARAFLDAGARRYIAPSDAPYGHASVFAILLLFYELTAGRTVEQAFERLQSYDDELSMWRMYETAADGRGSLVTTPEPVR